MITVVAEIPKYVNMDRPGITRSMDNTSGKRLSARDRRFKEPTGGRTIRAPLIPEMSTELEDRPGLPSTKMVPSGKNGKVLFFPVRHPVM